LVVVGSCVAMTTMTGCAYQGLNSLPLPGAVGRGSDATIYHVEVANIGTLESNSPVMMNDVVVGSVGKMDVRDWHANVEISVKPDVVVPATVVASVGQTSLLGSMHLALNPPLGEQPTGKLAPGATLILNQSSTYPSTNRRCRRCRRSSTAAGWGRSATSSTASTWRCPAANRRSVNYSPDWTTSSACSTPSTTTSSRPFSN
jgi:virulence factor Mce-like protein